MSKKSKSTTTNEPSQYSKQYISPAADALGASYQQAQPGVNTASSLINQNLPGLASQAFGTNPNVQAAQGYNTDVLGGKYLGQSNPYLASMVNQTDNSVQDRVNSEFGAAGRTGGDQHVQVLGQQLSQAENALRYGDYANERNAMATAAGQAPGLAGAQYAGIAPFLATASGTTLPIQAAQQYANGTGSLVGNYNTSNSTQTTPFLNSIAGIAGAGLGGWASGGFKGV